MLWIALPWGCSRFRPSLPNKLASRPSAVVEKNVQRTSLVAHVWLFALFSLHSELTCAEYGQCGVGAFCLGGCDPRNSNKLESCVPAPVCNSQDYKHTSLDDIAPNTDYLGDSSKASWVSSGTPKVYQNQVLLTLSETGASGSGTLLASTSYVWYGKITAQLKTSRGQGVVTAFVLMSDVQDEIDFEFVGVELETAQSNYYFQGIPDCM